MTREENLIDLLIEDHRAIKRLFAAAALGGDRTSVFCELVHALVVHEVAEEELVYPAFRRLGELAPESEAVTDARLAEQHATEAMLLEMERMDPATVDFARALSRLEHAVLAHAEQEELGVFRRLRAGLDEDEQIMLGEAYQVAKRGAPTHPHPHVPKNQLLVPILALIDRARDGSRSVFAHR